MHAPLTLYYSRRLTRTPLNFSPPPSQYPPVLHTLRRGAVAVCRDPTPARAPHHHRPAGQPWRYVCRPATPSQDDRCHYGVREMSSDCATHLARSDRRTSNRGYARRMAPLTFPGGANPTALAAAQRCRRTRATVASARPQPDADLHHLSSRIDRPRQSPSGRLRHR